MPLRLETLAVEWLDADGNKSLDRTSQQEGLPPLLGEFAERGQAHFLTCSILVTRGSLSGPLGSLAVPAACRNLLVSRGGR